MDVAGYYGYCYAYVSYSGRLNFTIHRHWKYRKRQKLSERKVSRLTGFLPNVGKTCAAFASFILKVPLLLKAFVGKPFAIHRKSAKTTKVFFSVALVIYGKFLEESHFYVKYSYRTKNIQKHISGNKLSKNFPFKILVLCAPIIKYII